MKNIVSLVLFAVTAIFIFGAASTYTFDEPAGLKVFNDQKCITCHSVEAVELISKNKKTDIPDLSKLEGELDADFLKSYLKKQAKLHDKDHATAFKGSEEELAAVVDWIISLNSSGSEKEEPKEEKED